MFSQKILIEDSIMMNVKENEKLSAMRLVVKQMEVERDCILVYKKGSKADTLQIRYINVDNTIDQLELKFKGKSISVDKANMSTNEYNLLDPYRVISKADIENPDLNKIEVNLGGLYVPAVILLTKFLKERATSKTLQSILKGYQIIENKRIHVETAKDKKEMSKVIIDLNVYDANKKVVDLKDNQWKTMEQELLKDKENKRCLDIFEKSKDVFANEDKESKKISSKQVSNNNNGTEENEGKMKNNKELQDKIVVRLLEYRNMIDNKTLDLFKEVIKLMVPELDVDTLFALKEFRQMVNVELCDDCKNASTPEEYTLLGQAMTVVTSISNMDDNLEAKLLGKMIDRLKEEFKDEEGIEEIDFEEILKLVEEAANEEDKEEAENKEEEVVNEEETKTMGSQKVSEDKKEEVKESKSKTKSVVESSLLEYISSSKEEVSKYTNILKFVKEKLEPSVINKISVQYPQVKAVMDMYTKEELNHHLIYKLDYVKELIEVLTEEVPGYEMLKAILANVTVGVRANIIYSLCNEFNRNIVKANFNEKVIFFTVFEDMFNDLHIELVKEDDIHKLMISRNKAAIEFYIHREGLFNAIAI